MALENTAVHLAMIDRFLREQDSRFLSALKIGDPQISLAQMEDIVEAEKVLLQSIVSFKSSLTRQQAADDRPSPTSTYLVPLLLIVMLGTPLVVCAISILISEYGLFLLLGLYVCMIDPILNRMQLLLGRLTNWLLYLSLYFLSFITSLGSGKGDSPS
jgi:hypothetical protein